ncbi:MAG: SRPBCC family protein [bacterium]
MVIFKDTIEIKATPEKVFDWFANMEKNYKIWHKDHKECRYLKGDSLEIGSVIYVEEYIDGYLEKTRFQITNTRQYSQLEYKALFPHSIGGARFVFIIEPYNSGSLFTTELHLGHKIGLLNRFIQILCVLFNNKLKAVKQHITEEQENLKRILEEG